MKWYMIMLAISFSAIAQDPCKDSTLESRLECNKIRISQLEQLPLPEICRSAKSQDRASCGMWIVKHQIPEACQLQSEENIAKCDTWIKSQSKPTLEKGMKNFKTLSPLEFCEMAADETQITCGEKIYVLSGSVNNMKRINSKIDLDSSPAKKPASKSSSTKAQ